MPNALKSDGVPDHNAIIASSYRVVVGGVQFRGSTSEDQSSVEQGSNSPRASAVVTTGGVANTRVMVPENIYIQKYILQSDILLGGTYRLKVSASTHWS